VPLRLLLFEASFRRTKANMLPMLCSRLRISRDQSVCIDMMYKINGPNSIPCGTPALMVVNFDFILPIFTRCLRWHRNDVSYFYYNIWQTK